MYSHLPEALVTHVAGPVVAGGHVNSFSTTLFIELLLTHEKFGGNRAEPDASHVQPKNK